MSPADWTRGEPGIAYQSCPACGAAWAFRRAFCPRCGNGAPEARQASGRGTVHAVTLVARAPDEALRAHAPYALLLVDAEEGFRLMAHGEPGLAKFGGRLVPRFVRDRE